MTLVILKHAGLNVSLGLTPKNCCYKIILGQIKQLFCNRILQREVLKIEVFIKYFNPNLKCLIFLAFKSSFNDIKPHS